MKLDMYDHLIGNILIHRYYDKDMIISTIKLNISKEFQGDSEEALNSLASKYAISLIMLLFIQLFEMILTVVL